MPAARFVAGVVIRWREYFQIFEPIIARIAISVVDMQPIMDCAIVRNPDCAVKQLTP